MSAADTQMPQGMDADVWATMTPEEREGIAGSEYTPDELAAMSRIAGEGGSGDDGNDDDDADAAGDDTASGGEDGSGQAAASDDKTSQDGDAGQGDKPAAAAEPPASDAQPVTPRYEAKLPEDYQQRVDALATAQSEAWQKFNDGDLDQAGLQAELSRIDNERSDLNALKIEAGVFEKMNAQTAQQQWESTVNRAINDFSKPENGGIDYRKDQAKMADLDGFVKALASKDENADKPMDWFLREAHKRVQALHGLTPAPAKETPQQAAARRQPDLNAAPKTLAHVPGGDGPGDVGGEFAEIDQLDGNDLEAAIARMTPAQRERYAQAR